MIQKKKIPEMLDLALEVCFQRDEIPHKWSRGATEWRTEVGDFPGDLYCEADLTDEEWSDYVALAYGEYLRATRLTERGADPDVPVLPASFVFDKDGNPAPKAEWALRKANKLRLYPEDREKIDYYWDEPGTEITAEDLEEELRSAIDDYFKE